MMVRLKIVINHRTKIPQMKICACPEYIIKCRPDLYNLRTKKGAEDVTKN